MPTRDTLPGLGTGLLRLVLLAALIVFVATNASTVTSAVAGLGQSNIKPILVGLTLSVVAMLNRGLLNHAAHRAVGLAPTRTQMANTTAVSFAANKLLQSGGASGLAVFLRHGKARGFPGGRVAASCLIASVAALVALSILFSATVGLLAVSGRLTGWWLAASVGFAVYAVGVTVIARCALRSQSAMTRLWASTQRLRNRLTRRNRDIDLSGLDDLYEAFTLTHTHRPWARRAVAHAVASKALGAAMLLAAAVAAGVPLSPTGAIVIYAAALAASFVSILPAGVGVVEASVGAMFAATGAPVAVAVVAVALYRIFDLWLPVGVGAFLGRKELRRKPPAEPEIETEIDVVTPATPRQLQPA